MKDILEFMACAKKDSFCFSDELEIILLSKDKFIEEEAIFKIKLMEDYVWMKK